MLVSNAAREFTKYSTTMLQNPPYNIVANEKNSHESEITRNDALEISK